MVFGLVGGLDFGLLGGLDNRGASYLRHRLLVVLLERQGLIAADLIRFLDYADGRILLRRAGGGYLSSTGWTRFFVHGCPPAPGFGIIDTGTPACTERTDTSPAGQRAR